MLKTVFGNCPQVKTIDFLLSTYDGHFNKTQIANGARISRPTLNKFLEKLLEFEIIKRMDGNFFELNNDSEIVKLIGKANILLLEMEIEKESNKNSYEKEKYSEEEMNDLVDGLFNKKDNLSEEEYQEKIAKKEKILVNKEEYDFLSDFYQVNKKISLLKMSKYMEKIINEATSDVLENMSKILLDIEQEASEKINQEFRSSINE